MKTRERSLERVALCLLGVALSTPAWSAEPPRLAVIVVVDQLGWETLERLRPRLGKGGIERLMTEGAVFSAAHYTHAATYTGPGHACIASGSYAHRNGIVSNNYFDRARGKSFTMLADAEQTVHESPASSEDDASPRALVGETVGDRLRLASGMKARVLAISLKDRSAVLLGGKLGAAYWLSEATGKMTTSTWYAQELPAWVRAFNEGRAPLESSVRGWVDATDREVEFIKAGVVAEQLGTRGVTDLLAVSFSAIDFIGHKHGPESSEVREGLIRLDRALGDLLSFLEARVGGKQHLAVVLTSDHGAVPTPESLATVRYGAGRIKSAALRSAVNAALTARFGAGEWVLALHDPAIYLNERLALERKVDFARVQEVAAEAALTVPGIAAAFTRAQLSSGSLPKVPFAEAVERSFYPARSGDLMLVPQPFFFWGKFGERAEGSTHGTPYSYDTHVPLVFWGAGVRRGEHRGQMDMADLAPTLAALLRLTPPASAEGQVRAEVFASARPD